MTAEEVKALQVGETVKIQKEGQTVTITGTVKDHSEYKDEKQTRIIRCKVAA